MLSGHTGASYTHLLIFGAVLFTCYLHFLNFFFFLKNCKSRSFVPMEAIFYCMPKPNLILPSVCWSTASLCICCRKLPVKGENSEQLSSTQWCKEGANGTSRGRDMAAVTATGWKSSTYIYKKKKSMSYFDSLHVTIKRNFLASYFPYKHSPLDS